MMFDHGKDYCKWKNGESGECWRKNEKEREETTIICLGK